MVVWAKADIETKLENKHVDYTITITITITLTLATANHRYPISYPSLKRTCD